MFVYIRATPLTLKRLDSCEQVDSSLSPKTNNNFSYIKYRIFSVPFVCLPTKTKPKLKPTTFSSAIFFSFYDGFLYRKSIFVRFLYIFFFFFYFTFYFYFFELLLASFSNSTLAMWPKWWQFKTPKEIPENVQICLKRGKKINVLKSNLFFVLIFFLLIFFLLFFQVCTTKLLLSVK